MFFDKGKGQWFKNFQKADEAMVEQIATVEIQRPVVKNMIVNGLFGPVVWWVTAHVSISPLLLLGVKLDLLISGLSS